MAVSEASVVISRPINEAWRYIVNAGNLSVWEPTVVEASQITEGPVAVGTRWRGTSRLLGVEWTWVGEFTQCDVNKGTAFKSVHGKLAFSNTTRFEEVDGETLFTYHMESESGLGTMFGTNVVGRILGRFTEPLVAAVYRRALRERLEHLAAVLCGV